MNNSYSEQILNKFAAKQWEKTLAYLQNQFNLSRIDCEDIFQDSFITLHQQILSGKLAEMSASLTTYFISICRNKAFERLRRNGTTVLLEDQFPHANEDSFVDEQIDKLIALDNSDNDIIEKRKQSLVRQIVKDLPSPCNELLWAFYRDGFSMKTLAQMFNYKNEDAVKVTKHRCCEKFKKRFEESINQLF